MKIPKKPVVSSDGGVAKETKVKELTGETVEIWHTQSIKQSIAYQSADCSYGVRLVVPNDKEAIREGITRAEKIVEKPMETKVGEQQELLKHLASQNR